ncbi:PKD domain-containing protein [Kitasatospora sp. NPDC056327]|uniref:PKD domain-containing protein n=1 Tax=Kitasatospora sp. NPDC056327 TaxID=3345785 RepID=UPI0035D83C26
MPVSRRLATAAAAAGSAIASVLLPFTAAHAESTVLRVDNGPDSRCWDTGAAAGTAAQPFCTVQAAADAALPGQTVSIAGNRSYVGQVTLRNSGLPGKPIVFRGESAAGRVMVGTESWKQGATPAPNALVFEGVHDITLTGLELHAPQEAVVVKDSARVTLDRNKVQGGNPVSWGVRAYPDETASVRITGASSDVTVSRAQFFGSPVAAVLVEPGASGTVVSTSQIADGRGRGVLATDAPGTVVVNNTFGRNCRTDVELAGNSAGAVVENNIVTKNPAPWCDGAQSDTTLLAVSAGSVQGTKADHNTVIPAGPATYTWGGTPHADPAAFRATGQGAHDNAVDPRFNKVVNDYTPVPAEGLTDAADPTAPGLVDTDVFGNAVVDHPGMPDTAGGHRDRGAVEAQDPVRANLIGAHAPGPHHPLNARFTAAYTTGWTSDTATLDFGDGSAPLALTPTTGPVDHDYPTAGTFEATLTVSGPAGAVRTSTSRLTVAPVPDLQARFTWGSGSRYESKVTVLAADVSPWPVARRVFDFGDGSAPVTVEGPNPPTGITHDYGVGGGHTVTETVTDDHGRTASTSSEVRASGPYGGVPFSSGSTSSPVTRTGLFDNGNWVIASNTYDSSYPGTTFVFGLPGDLPVVGNWGGSNASCRCAPGIYRPSSSTFALNHGNGAVEAVPFGDPGDLPLPGNWDGSRTKDQLAVYRPGNGLLAVRHDDGSVTGLRFGDPGDIPVVGDWDGVGHAQLGLFRPGRNPGDPNLFILRHDDGSVSTAAYGEKGDLPVVGDWLAKGRTTYGIHRPGTHRFALSYAYAGLPDVSYTMYGY